MNLPRFAVFLLLAVFSMTGCTRDIRTGDYGPLTIGQPKLEVLAALNAHGICMQQISPVPYKTHLIENPSRDDLDERLSGEAGVLVWVNDDHFPLRIEFVDNLVSEKWPEVQIASTAPELTKSKRRELARLDQLIHLGMSRAAVFDVLAEFKSAFGVTVGNFVVGYHQYHISRIPFASDPDYRKLLLANDGWDFYGLKDELWYEPFYSDVTIYFRNDRIERIEHRHFPIPLP